MRIALEDTVDGLRQFGLAAKLAAEDLRDRYRRSFISFGWITISFLVFVSIKGLVFNDIFKDENYDFFSHLTIGFAAFTFISTVITGSAQLFITNRTWILSFSQPYTVYAHILIIRAFVELGLVTVPTVILVILFGEINPAFLWTLPFAIVVYYATAFSMCLMFAPIGARHRDFLYAMQTVVRVLFFATPIIWVPLPGTARETVATYNPLSYYLDIVRVPVIEGRLPLGSWAMVCTITIGLLVVGMLVFNSTKRRIPLWL